MVRPARAASVGSQPDYRFSLANERTFLAWLRTGLALIAGGLAAAQFLPPLPVPHLREAIAVALLLLGGGGRACARSTTGPVPSGRCGSARSCRPPASPPSWPSSVALGALLLVVAVLARALG